MAAGTSLTFSGQITCDELLIHGIAVVHNHTTIDARRITVTSSGLLQIGTRGAPAENVVVYLRHERCAGASCIDGALLSIGNVRVHGLPVVMAYHETIATAPNYTVEAGNKN